MGLVILFFFLVCIIREFLVVGSRINFEYLFLEFVLYREVLFIDIIGSISWWREDYFFDVIFRGLGCVYIFGYLGKIMIFFKWILLFVWVELGRVCLGGVVVEGLRWFLVW